MNLRWIPAVLGPATAAALTLAAGCGTTSAPNPFTLDAGSDGSGGGGAGGAGGAGGGIAPADGGGDAGLILGGPCLDDGQCNDMIACTFDSCDTTLGRCLIIPDDSKCQNDVYCDGVEICDPTHGCIAGDPVTCDEGDECIIGTCVEATQSCSYAKLDADGDGDPDAHCGGKDCNDHDPNVSSLHVEVCANGIDDNCNGIIDETPCSSPEHATCLDPLQITASGTYAMTTVGATFSYPTSCGLGNMTGAADVVAAVLLPAGPPVDIEVTATSGALVSVAIAGQCGDPSTELACGTAFELPQGGEVSRARARGVGSATQATAFPVYVSTAPGSAVALDVQILPATTAPANQTCGTAAPITPGVPVVAEILDEAQNLGSACATPLGALVYTFTLAAPSDVNVYAVSSDGDGIPMISLRDAGCSLPTDEISCIESAPAHLYRQAVAAGTYYVSLSASAPTSAELTVALSAPTTPAPDQSCTGAPVIAPNVTIPVSLSTHEDDIDLGCDPGAVDAAYELDLAVASDVLLVERIAQGDTGAVGLALPACTQATALLCQTGSQSPVRTSQRNVPAGSYRVVAESLLAEDVQLTAFVRAAVPPTLVPLADGCAEAFAIPPQGGFFQGNTANSSANFPAGCDQGGVSGNGAPDQLLSLTLTTTQRVILDMEGSGYNTILDVRQGPPCPGTEIPMACAAGYGPQRSYLDLTLAPGLYYLQVDGFDLAEGPWFLDVRVVDPLIQLTSAVALGALGSLVPERIAAAAPLSEADVARLERGEVVRELLDLELPEGDYKGGVSYALIPAPAEDVMALLDDPGTYPSILPLTLEARVLPSRGRDARVFFRQGTRLGSAGYVLLVRRESAGLIRFWLDPSAPHEIADCWGYFRVRPRGKQASILTYAALIRLDPGLVKLVFSEKIRGYALSTPGVVRAYVMSRPPA